MEDKLKLKIKENQTFILAIIATVLFSLSIVFLISPTTVPNKEIEDLESIGIEINNINNSLNKGIKDLSLDISTSLKVLSSGIKELEELSIKLSSIEATSESAIDIRDELITALSTTIVLYDYSIYIIGNPENVVNTDTISEFTSYRDDCLNSYKLLTERGIELSFSDETLIFFDNIKNYLNALIKVNKTQNIVNSQKRDFVIILKDIIPDLNILTEDLEPALIKIKEDNRDLQILIDDIKAKELSYKDVQNKLIPLSIPHGYGDYYTSLDEFFKLYTSYLSSFKTALIFDKSCDDPLKNKKEINDNYKNVFSKYQDILTSYSQFKELINNL